MPDPKLSISILGFITGEASGLTGIGALVFIVLAVLVARHLTIGRVKR